MTKAHYPLARERVETLSAMTGFDYDVTHNGLQELIRDANQSRRNGGIEYRIYLRACLAGAEQTDSTTLSAILITLF